MLHVICTWRNRGDSRLLVVASQIGNLTFDLSFGHNLCFRFLNGSCKPILDIYVLRVFQWYKELLSQLNFDHWNCSLKIRKSTGTPIPKVEPPLKLWRFIVATLALDSRPRQGFARLWAKNETGSHTTYSRECESVWGNEHSHPQGVPLWELESRWILKSSEDDCKG